MSEKQEYIEASTVEIKIQPVIRLVFDGIPNQDIRAAMKEGGFYWNKFDKFWYADKTEASEDLAKTIEAALQG